MKKYAWTIMEMSVALIIIIVLSGLCVNSFKPASQKSKFYTYSTIANLVKGNIAVVEGKNVRLDSQDLIEGTTRDWYCIELANAFSLDEIPNCSRNADSDDINFTFPNGVTVQGLASEWKAQFSGANYTVKNIVIDLDGSSGINKVWADRFPLRIISGFGRGTEGLVIPVNCGNEKAFNGTEMVDVASDSKNPYCKQGFDASGADVTTDFTKESDVISYDVFQANRTAADEEGTSKAELLATSQSFFEADCKALGSVAGYFSVQECDSAQIRIMTQCATSVNCANCTSNTCPLDSSGNATTPETCAQMAQANNPYDVDCFYLLHKPSGGTSFIIQSLVGDADELGN